MNLWINSTLNNIKKVVLSTFTVASTVLPGVPDELDLLRLGLLQGGHPVRLQQADAGPNIHG